VWYIVALILLIMMQTPILMYIGVFMVGISVGGICNLIPSLIGTIFGRKDFAAANRFISALTKLIQACAYLYMGKMTAAFHGNMNGAYVGLIVICVIAFVLISLIKPFKTAEAA
jgi:MFS family permease